MRSIGMVSLLLSNVLVNGLMPPQVSSTSSLGSRRAFLDASVAAVAFLPFLVMTQALAADGDTFEDLTMPTPEEVKVQEEAMAARLKRKAELQKKAAKPSSFIDSLQNEKQKQQEYSKASKEERRNALCEELGRGC